MVQYGKSHKVIQPYFIDKFYEPLWTGIQNSTISLLLYILRAIQEVTENALYNQLSMTIDFSDAFCFFPPQILSPCVSSSAVIIHTNTCLFKKVPFREPLDPSHIWTDCRILTPYQAVTLEGKQITKTCLCLGLWITHSLMAQRPNSEESRFMMVTFSPA